MRSWKAWVVGGVILLVLLVIGLGLGWFAGDRRERRFDAEIRRASKLYGVEPALIKAVIWKESRFDPAARGKAGEIGLMQIRELAAVEWTGAEGVRGFELEHLADPTTNILAGSWYLARRLRLYRQADDPVPYALADYNAGRAHVLRWMATGGATTNSDVFVRQVGFPSTQRYIWSVMDRRERYRGEGG